MLPDIFKLGSEEGLIYVWKPRACTHSSVRKQSYLQPLEVKDLAYFTVFLQSIGHEQEEDGSRRR